MEKDEAYLSLKQALDLLGEGGDSALLKACREGKVTLTHLAKFIENSQQRLIRQPVPRNYFADRVAFVRDENSVGPSGQTKDFAEFEHDMRLPWYLDLKASTVEIRNLMESSELPTEADPQRTVLESAILRLLAQRVIPAVTVTWDRFCDAARDSCDLPTQTTPQSSCCGN